MTTSRRWTRDELLVAFELYSRLSFGRMHERNPEIIRFAGLIGRTPGALAMKLTNIASLDPEIISSGRKGLRGASANDRAMWHEMHDDWSAFAVECRNAASDLEGAGESVDAVSWAPPVHSAEDRIAETKVRVGQAFFRDAVLSAYDGRCCITGLSVPTLLRAGHIVPWRVDHINRVNPRNGLLMTVLHERAFDAGIFTINDEFIVEVSRSHHVPNDEFFCDTVRNFHGRPISLPKKFSPDQQFLDYHRNHIFRP